MGPQATGRRRRNNQLIAPAPAQLKRSAELAAAGELGEGEYESSRAVGRGRRGSAGGPRMSCGTSGTTTQPALPALPEECVLLPGPGGTPPRGAVSAPLYDASWGEAGILLHQQHQQQQQQQGMAWEQAGRGGLQHRPCAGRAHSQAHTRPPCDVMESGLSTGHTAHHHQHSGGFFGPQQQPMQHGGGFSLTPPADRLGMSCPGDWPSCTAGLNAPHRHSHLSGSQLPTGPQGGTLDQGSGTLPYSAAGGEGHATHTFTQGGITFMRPHGGMRGGAPQGARTAPDILGAVRMATSPPPLPLPAVEPQITPLEELLDNMMATPFGDLGSGGLGCNFGDIGSGGVGELGSGGMTVPFGSLGAGSGGPGFGSAVALGSSAIQNMLGSGPGMGGGAGAGVGSGEAWLPINKSRHIPTNSFFLLNNGARVWAWACMWVCERVRRVCVCVCGGGGGGGGGAVRK